MVVFVLEKFDSHEIRTSFKIFSDRPTAMEHIRKNWGHAVWIKTAEDKATSIWRHRTNYSRLELHQLPLLSPPKPKKKRAWTDAGSAARAKKRLKELAKADGLKLSKAKR